MIIKREPPRYATGVRDEAEEKVEAIRHKRLLKAFAVATEIGLDDDERHELALMIPGVDKDGSGSWKDLNPRELHDLITKMEGYLEVKFLLDNRG